MNRQPILAVDVDGVISLFGFDAPPPPLSVAWHLIDGTPHCISLAAGERLGRLTATFELVWATGWQDRANDRLPQVIGIGPLPVIEFDLPDGSAGHDTGSAPARPSPGPATGAGSGAGSIPARPSPGPATGAGAGAGAIAGHWTREARDRVAAGRAIAWIDDSLDRSCFEWAERREAAGSPTLLAPTEPEIGIEEGHVAALESWARGLDFRLELSR